jgi:hypothetical protein
MEISMTKWKKMSNKEKIAILVARSNNQVVLVRDPYKPERGFYPMPKHYIFKDWAEYRLPLSAVQVKTEILFDQYGRAVAELNTENDVIQYASLSWIQNTISEPTDTLYHAELHVPYGYTPRVGYSMVGDIFNDNAGRFKDGTTVTTSPVTKIQGNLVSTEHSIYKLVKG